LIINGNNHLPDKIYHQQTQNFMNQNKYERNETENKFESEEKL
jgi:hypothetical protein